MVKINTNHHQNSGGFALLEVLIATLLFALFAAVFVNSQSTNINISLSLDDEVRLKELAQMKLNEIILNPPDLTKSLTMTAKIKTFENYIDYEYKIEWKNFEIPDMEKIKGNEESNEEKPSSPFEKILYEQISSNLKELIWQVRVTITNKQTKYHYSISTWILNNDAKVTMGKL